MLKIKDLPQHFSGRGPLINVVLDGWGVGDAHGLAPSFYCWCGGGWGARSEHFAGGWCRGVADGQQGFFGSPSGAGLFFVVVGVGD